MLPVAGDELLEALNVRVMGDEEAQLTLVLAHGFGCTQTVWEDVLPTLLNHPIQGGIRTIIFDWPGAASTELTPQPAFYPAFSHILLSILQHLHVSSCIYVGHSMAAMIGCIAALRQPDLFDKLILVGASPRYLNTEAYYGGFEQEELDQLYGAMANDFHGWAAGFARAVVGADADKEAVAKFEAMLSGMQPEVALGMAKSIFQSDHRGVLEDLADKLHNENIDGMKVVVLQTRKDGAVPPAVSDYLKLHLGSKARVEVLQVEGHVPHLSAPHLFTSALLNNILD
ncbi:hypothetical protein GOP47_0004384 [Adiantum capillus-veneris]|uniref:AB hydrolase-1 domain-containing protein n=1 Tax=Adiantum capillus-veneris TaxID=13818 RepID=A0A9D4V8K6_ADICA|nr:hypothetical protein GOP47_0004384 [Adiantum capillus-veneris]